MKNDDLSPEEQTFYNTLRDIYDMEDIVSKYQRRIAEHTEYVQSMLDRGNYHIVYLAIDDHQKSKES